MAGKGSNDLNLLLKSQVVKIRAELDVPNSMTKIREQVKDISSRLDKENKRVKIKVELDASIEALKKQFSGLQTKIQGSKTIKPIKLQVQIDVEGSAKKIKEQLGEINKTVQEFNKNYAQQMKKFNEQVTKAQQAQGKLQSQSKAFTNIPMNADVQNFNNIKQYVSQLKEAERIMKTKLPKGEKGLFSSFEMKDANGNLKGFISTLERANGVVDKIKYSWNADKNKFMVIDRTTATQTEKAMFKQMQALKDLEVQIGKTGEKSSKFKAEYDKLMSAGGANKLTQEMVKDYDRKIKKEIESIRNMKFENDALREQKKLIAEINREKDKSKSSKVSSELGSLKSQLNNMDITSPMSKNFIADIRRQFSEVKQGYSDQLAKEKDLTLASKKRLEVLGEIGRISKSQYLNASQGSSSKKYIEETRQMAKNIKTTEEYIAVRKRMDATNRELKSAKIDKAIEKELVKLEKVMKQWAVATGKNIKNVEDRFEQVKHNVKGNLGQIENEVTRFTRLMNKAKQDSKLTLERETFVGGKASKDVKALLGAEDNRALKEYISNLNKAELSMLKVQRAGNTTKIQAQLKSTGKTAKEVTYEFNHLNSSLNRIGTKDVFNANRNLGVFEQLKIAMARVPIWMTAMTAFYGSINAVKQMSQEILKLDKALTELKRVASDSLNIETIFKGSIQMSKDLGNNIHDVMATVNDLSRTFGNFNERQLLAIANTATLMSNVSDLTAQEAGSTLVGTMNAFNIEAEESIRIVDALNEVDNDYAISTKQLAEGLQKSASTSKTFGVSLEENIGAITAIGSVTMESGAIIGNSLKTIYSRITTLENSRETLEGIGVELHTIGKNGQEDVRPVNDILGDLANRWFDLSDSQRQNIAVTVAGRYQLSRFLALMNNWETATSATNTAIFSQGSAMRENAEYLKSFEARINKLKNSFTELSNSVGNAVLSAGLMGVIEGLTKLAGVAIKVVDTVGALPVLFGVIAGLLLKFGVFKKLTTTIATSLGHMQLAFAATGSRATMLGTAMARMSLVGSAGMAGLRASAIAGATSIRTSFATMLMHVRTFSTGFRMALASTGIGLLIVGIGFLAEKLMKMYQENKQKQEELVKMNKKMVDSYREHSDGMASVVKRYEELSSMRNRTKAQEQEYIRLQKELAETLPTTVAFIDANGKAHLKNVDSIKREVEIVKELSKAQAELTEAKFNSNMEKRSKAYEKVTKSIEKLHEKQREQERDNGKSTLFTGGNFGANDMLGGEKLFTIENDERIQKTKVEILMAEADKTKAIQGTTKAVQDQILAHFEARGQLVNLGDAQQSVIEKFVSYNEAMIRHAKTPEEFEKAYRDLFSVGVEVGEVFSEAFTKMSKGMENDPLKLNTLKKDLGEVANAIPDTFFQMTDEFGKPIKSIDEVTDGLKEIINVSNRVKQGDGNWDGLIKRLQKAGLSADEAKGYLNGLAREHDNAKLRAEAQAQGVDGVTSSLEDLNEKTMDAIDLTSTLFGYSKSELGGIKSHLQAMHLLVDANGEGAKSSQAYLESQEAVTDFLGISNSELEANKNKIFDVILALDELDLSTYGTADSFDAFVLANKELTDAQKNLLIEWAKTDGAKDILTGANIEVVKSNEEVKKSAEEIIDVFSKEHENKIAKSMKETKKVAEDTSWFDNFIGFMQELTGIGDKDNTGLGDWFEKFIPKSMNEDLEKARKSIEKFFEGLPSKISKGLSNLGKSIDDGLGNLPSKTWNKLSEWEDSMNKWLKDKFKAIDLSGWWKGIGDWFDNLPEKTAPKLDKWYVSMKEWFANMPKRIALEMGTWYESIYDFFDALPSKVKEKWDLFSDSFISFFDGMPTRIFNKLLTWGKAFDDWIDEQDRLNKEAFSGWKDNIVEWFESIPSKIRGAFLLWSTEIGLWIYDNKGTWSTGLATWWDSISEWVTSIPEKFHAKLDEWNKGIVEWFETSAPKWDENLAKWGDAIGLWWDNFPETTIEKLGIWWETIKSWFSLTTWKENLDGWWKSISDWFSSLGENKEVKDSSKKVVKKFSEGISENKKDILEKFAEFILDLPGYLLMVGGVLLLALGRELIQRIIKGITETIPEWLGKWHQLKVWAINKLIELGGEALSWGKEMIVKLVKGISEKLVKWKGSWDEIKNSAKEKIIEARKEIISIAESIPKKMGEGISKFAGDVASGVTSLVNKISSGIEKGLNNTIIKGVNTVLTYMGVDSSKHLKNIDIPQFAKGTDKKGHMGGEAIVGEKGRELAYIPNQGYTVLGKNGAEIVDLPKGTSVLPNKETEVLLKKHGFPAYENGVGDFFDDLMDSPKALMSKVFASLNPFSMPKGSLGDIGMGALGKAKSYAVDFISQQLKEFTKFTASVASSFGGVFKRTSGYGKRKNPTGKGMSNHKGVDYSAPSGTPIPSQSGGKVVAVGYNSARGNYVRVKSGNIEYLYQHNSKNLVAVGDSVKKGQVIGKVGSTGDSTGSHLHYEVWVDGVPIDPEKGHSFNRGKGGMGGSSSSMGASGGEGGGEGGTGGTGTSGIMQESIYTGGITADGGYMFSVSELAEMANPNYNEREMTVWGGVISQLEGKMQRLTQNSVEYREHMKEVLFYQNKILENTRKELSVSESRNSVVLTRIGQLERISSHTEQQREEYNNLQQEFEQNISKIASLKGSIETLVNDVRSKSVELFANFIDEVIIKYNGAIAEIQKKVDDIEFKIDVIGLTNPDNIEEQLMLLASKTNELQREEQTLGNKRDDLKGQYNNAVSRYGAGSEQAKKVLADLEEATEAWEDAVIKALQSEKEISDVRGEIADNGISSLKDYYGNMKDMSLKAIEIEKRELEKAHKFKMDMYDSEVDKINSVYDAKLKQMDDEKSQEEYQKNLDEKSLKKTELMNKISLLSRDTTLEGRKKVEEMKKELTSINEEISNMQKEHAETLLREQLEIQKQSQIDAIESQKESQT